MGQNIDVRAVPMGNVAMFATNRSFTGQDPRVFTAPPENGADWPSVLASRLFDSVDDVDHVHVLSNVVTVGRHTGWSDDDVESATEVIENLFVFYRAESPEEHDQALRDQHYNATITHIRAHNPDLWVFRVKPDEPAEPFDAGQYTTLALGYWEPRADDAVEEFTTEQREKLARRSYSVSSSMIDEDGELRPPHTEEIEFYVVRVEPTEDRIPALTPRIFTKDEGDRIFMGRKFTGHYTLEGVEPGDTVVFLSTGTGEAPQNAMIAELLRRGHKGQILNAVCVRYKTDLAYTSEHAVLSERHRNYTYITLTTREPETINNKVYIQDLISSGRLEEELGGPLDPSHTHVYLCGNPSMIGLPEWDEDGSASFPDVVGVCQLLHERGFTIDRRRERGEVHYEEYWTDK